jgi:hypothetical protein
MRIIARLAILMTAVGLGPVVSAGTVTTQFEIPCGEKVQQLCEAARISNVAERHDKLRRLIAVALEVDDEDVREQAFSYLAQVSPFPLDPRPLRTSLERFDELGDLDARRGRSLYDMAKLAYAPRAQRAELYRRAIIEGSAAVGDYGSLPRSAAMEMASREGLVEVGQAIREHYSELDPTERESSGPLEGLLAAMELRNGGENYGDSGATAMRRLNQMTDDDLGARIETSAGWRRALLDVKHQVCQSIPPAPECEPFVSLMRRQLSLFDQRRKQRAQAQAVAAGTSSACQPSAEERAVMEWFGEVDY